MPDAINIPQEEALPVLTANLVPCHLQYNGPANTREYFTPSKSIEVNSSGENEHIAHFRGLKLVGETVFFGPPGYKGFLINKSESIERVDRDQAEESSQGDEQLATVNTYNAVAQFDDLIVYGHDSKVAPNCQWKLMDEWTQISNVIHD